MESQQDCPQPDIVVPEVWRRRPSCNCKEEIVQDILKTQVVMTLTRGGRGENAVSSCQDDMLDGERLKLVVGVQWGGPPGCYGHVCLSRLI